MKRRYEQDEETVSTKKNKEEEHPETNSLNATLYWAEKVRRERRNDEQNAKELKKMTIREPLAEYKSQNKMLNELHRMHVENKKKNLEEGSENHQQKEHDSWKAENKQLEQKD